MSHRALVAIERRDGRFDVFEARDAGGDGVLDQLLPPDVTVPPVARRGSTVGRTRTLESLFADYLDPIGHEAVVVERRGGPVTPYLVIPYVLATGDGLAERDPRGAALALVGRDGAVLRPAYVHGWAHGTTDVLGEAVERGALPVDEAVTWLADAVRLLAGDGHELFEVPAGR